MSLGHVCKGESGLQMKLSSGEGLDRENIRKTARTPIQTIPEVHKNAELF